LCASLVTPVGVDTRNTQMSNSKLGFLGEQGRREDSCYGVRLTTMDMERQQVMHKHKKMATKKGMKKKTTPVVEPS